MTTIKSTIGLKYPPYRDDLFKTSSKWLKGRRETDNAEGLWRIHNKLYDLNTFIGKHPGGKEWLQLTKGTDITEAFETHHLKGIAELLLPKFYVKEVTSPRNSPFTFNSKDFYMTLKQNVIKEMQSKNIPTWPAKQTKLITDVLVLSYFILGWIAVYLNSYFIGLLSGIGLGLTAIAAHNFFHQKNNFRMYYFDLILIDSQYWKISHVLSHHLFTNTVDDLEISLFEPFFHYLPVKKSIYQKLFSVSAFPFVCSFMNYVFVLNRLYEIVLNKQNLSKTFFIPLIFIVPSLFLGKTILSAISMYFFIMTVATIHFTFVGVNAGHHHPNLFHDGDVPPTEKDWGLHQLDTTADRNEITGSMFLVLTNYGDHVLHHLFPTLDHSMLDYLYPVFKKTLKDFGLEWNFTTQGELIKGQFQRLLSSKIRSEKQKW